MASSPWCRVGTLPRVLAGFPPLLHPLGRMCAWCRVPWESQGSAVVWGRRDITPRGEGGGLGCWNGVVSARMLVGLCPAKSLDEPLISPAATFPQGMCEFHSELGSAGRAGITSTCLGAVCSQTEAQVGGVGIPAPARTWLGRRRR